MKVARQKGVETILNPAPAVPLPEEAYQGLGHLIVNETEAAILSGIEIPTNWNKVAAVFIARGVKNVIITLGGEVGLECQRALIDTDKYPGRLLQDSKTAVRVTRWPHRTCTKSQSGRHDSCGRYVRGRIQCLSSTVENHVTRCRLRPRRSDRTRKPRCVDDGAESRRAVEYSLVGRGSGSVEGYDKQHESRRVELSRSLTRICVLTKGC
jgi:hypothetical protein